MRRMLLRKDWKEFAVDHKSSLRKQGAQGALEDILVQFYGAIIDYRPLVPHFSPGCVFLSKKSFRNVFLYDGSKMSFSSIIDSILLQLLRFELLSLHPHSVIGFHFGTTIVPRTILPQIASI